MSRQEYLNSIKQGAIQSWQEYKILPSITGAQAALESGWGSSRLAKPPYNNNFGVKASDDWTGQKIAMQTQEFLNGRNVTVTAEFRAYSSIGESIKDHGSFFTNTPWRVQNYRNIPGERDYKKAAQALQSAGYATDPAYSSKLIRIIEENNLVEWDKEAFAGNTVTNLIANQSNINEKIVGGSLSTAATNEVKNYTLSVIGDSLGVGTEPHFKKYPWAKANYDNYGSRQWTHGTAIYNAITSLQNMANAGTLNKNVVFILGTNRGVTIEEINQAVGICGRERNIILVDTASEVNHKNSVSETYKKASQQHDNVYYANWSETARSNMSQYYHNDGANGTRIHMTTAGYKAHADFIIQAIYQANETSWVEELNVVLPKDKAFIDIFDIDYDDGKFKSPQGDSSIYNEELNNQFGFKPKKGQIMWIERVYEGSEDNTSDLLASAIQYMEEHSLPGVQYTVAMKYLPNNISIGDTGLFIDHNFNPPLYIKARVLSISTSESNPNNDSVVIGNVVELFPTDKSDILSIQRALQETREEFTSKYFDAKPIRVEINSSNGLSFSTRAASSGYNLIKAADRNVSLVDNEVIIDISSIKNEQANFKLYGKINNNYIDTVEELAEEIQAIKNEVFVGPIDETTNPQGEPVANPLDNTEIRQLKVNNFDVQFLNSTGNILYQRNLTVYEDSTFLHELNNINPDVKKIKITANRNLELSDVSLIQPEVIKEKDLHKTSLEAKVYIEAEEITHKYNSYSWIRISNNTRLDENWNDKNKWNQTNKIDLSIEDINGEESVFLCKVFDKKGEFVVANSVPISIMQEGNKNTISDSNTPPSDPYPGDKWVVVDGTEEDEFHFIDGEWVQTGVSKKVEAALEEAEEAKLAAQDAYEKAVEDAKIAADEADALIKELIGVEIGEVEEEMLTSKQEALAAANKALEDAKAHAIAQDALITAQITNEIETIETELSNAKQEAVTNTNQALEDAKAYAIAQDILISNAIGSEIDSVEAGLVAAKQEAINASNKALTDAKAHAIAQDILISNAINAEIDSVEAELSTAKQEAINASNKALTDAKAHAIAQDTIIKTAINAEIAKSNAEIVIAKKAAQDAYTNAVNDTEQKIATKDEEYQAIFDDYDIKTEQLDADVLTANEKAASALTKANASTDLATAAKTIADQAKTTADTAKTTADTAKTNADTAKTSASEAGDVANQAIADALKATTDSTTALDGVTSLTPQVATAVSNASSALTKANTAVANADKAITDSGSALTQVGTLTPKVTSAVSNASSALSKANSALTDSQTAISKANALETTTGTLTTNYNNLTGTVSLKADKTTVDALSGTVNTQGLDITTNADAIAMKADSSVVNAIKGTVDTHTTQIGANATAITSKANTSTVNTLTGRVSTAETTITQHATAIASKASNTSVDTLTGRVSTAETTLTQQATQISARLTNAQVETLVTNKGYSTVNYVDNQIVASASGIRADMSLVEGKIDNLQIGGRNLLKGTSNTWTVLNMGTEHFTNLDFKDTILEVGKTYTFSIIVEKVSTDTVPINLHIGTGTTTYQKDITGWRKNSIPFGEKVSLTYTVAPGDLGTFDGIFTYRLRNETRPTTIRYKMDMLEVGNIASDWSPAPEDTLMQNDFNTFKASYEATAQSLTSRLTAIDKTDGRLAQAESLITQTANGLTQRYTKTETNNLLNAKATTGSVTALSTEISTIAGQMTQRYTKTEVNNLLTNKANTSALTGLATQTWTTNQITSSATGTMQEITRVENKIPSLTGYATQTWTNNQISTTADSITSTISQVESKVDGMKFGGRNLLPNSLKARLSFNNHGGVDTWRYEGDVQVAIVGANRRLSTYSGISFDKSNLIEGETYTFSYDVMPSKDSYMWLDYRRSANKVLCLANKWTRIYYTREFASGEPYLLGVEADLHNEVVEFKMTRPQIEKGNIVSEWSPAPEDMATVTALTQATQDLSGFKTLVQNTYGTKTDVSAVTQTANNLVTELTRVENKIPSLSGYATQAWSTTQINTKAGEITTSLTTEINKKATPAQITNAILADKTIKDTRDDNQTPKWYRDNYPQQSVREFKTSNALGLTTAQTGGTFGVLTTEVTWSGSTGGKVKQTLVGDSATFERRGNTAHTAWEPWQELANTTYVNTTVNQKAGEVTQLITEVKTNPTGTITGYNSLTNNVNSMVQAIGTDGGKIAQMVMTDSLFSTKVLEQVQVGGTNLVLNSENLSVSGLGQPEGSRAEYRYLEIGQSLMDVEAGTPLTLSFDIETVDGVDSLMIYNTNRPGPKNIPTTSIRDIPAGKSRQAIQTTVIDNPNTTSYTWNTIEFYSVYGTNHFFKISKLKIERGNVATDWSPAPEDKASQSEVTQLADSWALTLKSGNDVKTSINATTNAIRLKADLIHLSGTSLIDNATIKSAHIDTLNANKVVGTSAEFNTIRSGVLQANVIQSTHLSVDNAFIDKLFATDALVGRLTAKTAFINSVKAVDIDAVRITTGTINSARINATQIVANGLTANVIKATHIQGDTALIDTIFATQALVDGLWAKSIWTNKINAIQINASQITAGTIATARLNATDIVTSGLTANIIKATHIQGDTALIDTIFATQALVDGLWAKSIWTSKITTMSLNASQISAGTIATARLNAAEIVTSGLTTNVVKATHIQSDTALIDTVFATQAMVDRLWTKTIWSSKINAIQINASQINAGTIAAARLDATTLKTLVLTANSVTATHILGDNALIDNIFATQALVDRLWAKSIWTTKLTALQISAGQISSGTIDTARLNATQIVTNGLSANVITSVHISADTALIDKMFATTALIDRLTSKTAFITNIKAIDIDAARITSGTISASRIAANSITIGQIDPATTAKIEAGNTAKTAIDNLNVGGSNLILNSQNLNLVGTNAPGITRSFNAEGNLRITAAAGNGSYASDLGMNPSRPNIYANIQIGEWVTFSIEARSTNTTSKPTFYFGTGTGYLPLQGNLGTTWSKLYVTTRWNVANWTPHLGFSGIVGTIEFRNAQLEKGNVATDWSPAVTEVTTKAELAQSGQVVIHGGNITADTINVNTLTGNKSEFLQSAWTALNSYVSIDGSRIKLTNTAGDYVEMNNIPEFRSQDTAGTATIMGKGRTHYYGINNNVATARFYIGTSLEGTGTHGVHIAKGQTFGIYRMSDSYGGTPAQYHTVVSGESWRSITDKYLGASISVWVLADLNGKSANVYLQPGEVILIKAAIPGNASGVERLWTMGTATNGTTRLYSHVYHVFEAGTSLSSDRRIKHNIEESQVKALDHINALAFKQYRMNRDNSFVKLGLIAQDSGILRVADDETEGIDLQGSIMLALKGVQELQEVIVAQAEEIKQLKEIINK